MNRLRKLTSDNILFKRFPAKAGAAPGTVTHIGEQKVSSVKIHLTDFNTDHLVDHEVTEEADYLSFTDTDSVTWLKITGLHEVERLKKLWNAFNIHPLVQEDIVNTLQRPKVEAYGDQIFIVIKMISVTEDLHLKSEQISVVVSKNFVFSFQESDDDVFKPVVQRLQNAVSRLRSSGTDYLTYALIDTIIDYYFDALEALSEQLDQIEDELILGAEEDHLRKIHHLRREFIRFKKSVWPFRDALSSLLRDESPLITDETRIFLRDSHDHLFQVIESVEHSREIISGLHDMYMTDLSNKMNEVMKVLTIIATIFIPLTFIAGIYGMNFERMPELSSQWGYPAVWVVMIIITLLMIVYFRRKKWL